jgi:hypothetical protein
LIENNPTRTGILFQGEYQQKVNVTDTDTSPDGLTLACAPSFIYPTVVGKELLVIFVLAEASSGATRRPLMVFWFGE